MGICVTIQKFINQIRHVRHNFGGMRIMCSREVMSLFHETDLWPVGWHHSFCGWWPRSCSGKLGSAWVYHPPSFYDGTYNIERRPALNNRYRQQKVFHRLKRHQKILYKGFNEPLSLLMKIFLSKTNKTKTSHLRVPLPVTTSVFKGDLRHKNWSELFHTPKIYKA